MTEDHEIEKHEAYKRITTNLATTLDVIIQHEIDMSDDKASEIFVRLAAIARVLVIALAKDLAIMGRVLNIADGTDIGSTDKMDEGIEAVLADIPTIAHEMWNHAHKESTDSMDA